MSKEIFEKDIELPEVVNKKVNEAFAKIQEEEQMKKKRKWSKQTVAAACAGIILVGSVSTYAAVTHLWSRGMNEWLQATPKQQQELLDNGSAKILNKQENYEELAVTSQGITMTPETVVADERCAQITFSVKGYKWDEKNENDLYFNHSDFYFGNDPTNIKNQVNMSGGFYDGILSENGVCTTYDDGTPLEYDKDGGIIGRYVDKDGTMEYVVAINRSEDDESILGKTLHCSFEELNKGPENTKWEFDITLPAASSDKTVQVNKALGDFPFVVKDVNVSPISIQVNYDVDSKRLEDKDPDRIPEFCGFVLKDGSKENISDGGSIGYKDEKGTKAYNIFGYTRVVDLDQIEGIVFAVHNRDLVDPENENPDYVTIDLKVK